MSKLVILGSGAAEGIPSVFCGCRVCSLARRNGGKEVRTRTSYQIGEHVRIDCGPDTLIQEVRTGIDSSKIRHLIFTHSHSDHCYVPYLEMRSEFADSDTEPLHIYGDPGVLRKLNRSFWNMEYTAFDGNFRPWKFDMTTIHSFQPFSIPGEDLTFYPLRADHCLESPVEKPLLFVVRHGENFCLIGNDSGFYPQETWEYLAEKRFPLSLVISDGAAGITDQEHWHLGGCFQLKTRRRLEKLGLVTEKTRYVLSHIGHMYTHSELEQYFNPHGIEIGYDGMCLEWGTEKR